MSVDISNIGSRAGDEVVVQLYLRDVVASVTQPVKVLKGFKRLHLEAGGQKTVIFTLAVIKLGFDNQEMAYVVEPGAIDLMVGTSSDDLPLTASISIVGEMTELSREKVTCVATPPSKLLPS